MMKCLLILISLWIPLLANEGSLPKQQRHELGFLLRQMKSLNQEDLYWASPTSPEKEHLAIQNDAPSVPSQLSEIKESKVHAPQKIRRRSR